MNNSSDFMNYLHEDKIQRLRQEVHVGYDYKTDEMVNSPFARVRGAISMWVSGARSRDINQR